MRATVYGGDNPNKRYFGTKSKLFQESGDFSGNRDTWKFFRERRDNSGILQKKIGTSKEILFHVFISFNLGVSSYPNFRDDLSWDLVLLKQGLLELSAPVQCVR